MSQKLVSKYTEVLEKYMVSTKTRALNMDVPYVPIINFLPSACKTTVFIFIIYFKRTFMYFDTSFYDIYYKRTRSQSHIKIKVFVWFSIFNRPDDGLIDKPKLVTCKLVNFVVHYSDLECIYLTGTHQRCFT
jgi:hypothetical protein